MNKPVQHLIRWITLGSFVAFFVFGFSDNLKGPTLPEILKDLHLSYAQAGTVLSGAYVGFLIATLLAGMLADLAGKKSVILVAGACLASGIAGYASFSAFLPLFLSMFVLGMGLGCLEVGCNSIIVDLHPEQKGRFLNLLSVFHGLGSMIAPVYASALIKASTSWRTVYQGSLALVAVMLLLFLFTPYPARSSAKANAINFTRLQGTVFRPVMIGFYFLIAVYVAAEIGIASWIVEYLQVVKSQTVSLSNLSLSLFFGTMMVGRLVGSVLVDRVGYLRIILLASLAAALCVALGTFGPPALSLFLPLTGLFFSIIFPTITAAVSDLHKENTSTVLGLLFTFAGLGGMAAPGLIGFLSDRLGIQLGFGSLLALCALMPLTVLFLMKNWAGFLPEASLPSDQAGAA